MTEPRHQSHKAPEAHAHLLSPAGRLPFFLEHSPAALHLREQLQKVAATPHATLLLTGESGAGKEVAARWVHESSAQREKPFVPINCGGIAESLLERELFGHERGSFTGADRRSPGMFEMGLGGTVMLDEISAMSLAGQSRLLRVLEARSFRRVGGIRELELGTTRVIAAANTDLERLVHTGRFRKDLYFRLKVLPVHVPPLRERREDIFPLAEMFLKASSNGADIAFSPSTRRILEAYHYPGNIRELKHIVEHAALFSQRGVIQPTQLSFSNLSIPEQNRESEPESTHSLNLAQQERRLIEKALREAPSHAAAARALGITPQALYRRLEKFQCA